MTQRRRSAIVGKSAVAALFLVACGVSSGGAAADVPRVTGGAPVAYQCDRGVRVVARYFALADGTLQFVRVVLPEGKEYTLPAAVSGSGARYTDDREFVWWIKGSAAFAQTRDANGEWRTTIDQCRRVDTPE